MKALSLDAAFQIKRLTVRVRELEEELAEYRRRETERDTDQALLRRVREAKRTLGLPKMAAVILFEMAARPGHIFTREALRELSDPLGHGDPAMKVVDVQISRIRTALHAKGVVGAIETAWADGWLVRARGAAAIAALLGEGASE